MRLNGGLDVILEGSKVLASSSQLPPHQLDRFIRLAAANPSPEFVMAQPQMGRLGTHIAVHRLAAGGRRFFLLVAEPLDSVAAERAIVRRVTLIALPLILAFAGLGGYVLAASSLAP